MIIHNLHHIPGERISGGGSAYIAQGRHELRALRKYRLFRSLMHRLHFSQNVGSYLMLCSASLHVSAISEPAVISPSTSEGTYCISNFVRPFHCAMVATRRVKGENVT
jgi:hypothetical protein